MNKSAIPFKVYMVEWRSYERFIKGARVMKKFKKLSKILAGIIATAMIIPNIGAMPEVRAAGDVVINDTNFPDPNFRAAVSAYDTSGDGVLSKNERDMVMNLHCENSGIKSVKGIEYFTEIQGLWCLNNDISSWDLSKNKELVGIWCSHNSFTSLDFTGLDKLEWVYCYNCKLSSLNVKNNPKLAYLECNANPNLTSIDLTHNMYLENLFCSECGLTSLDLSGNPLLCELAAFKNKLTSLNLSNNKLLKRLDIWDNNHLGNVDISGLYGLEFYNCAKNDVTSLDMSNNPNLQLLICGYNDNLKYLNVTQNPRLADLRLECDYQLTSLDISNNHQLYNLYAFGLRDLPAVDISNNPYLIKTYMEGQYKAEPQLGYVHSLTIECGGSEEYFEDLTHCVVVDDGKDVIYTGGNPIVISECFIDENDGHSGSEVFATRGQAVQALWESVGSPVVAGPSRFTDVAGTSCEQAVIWAETYNICFGYPSICSDEFCPDELISREDFGLMAHRLALIEDYGTAFDYGRTDWFSDYYSIEYYGWGGFTWAIQFGVLGNDETHCYPHGRITMDELEAGVYRIHHLDEAANYSAIVNGNGTADSKPKKVLYSSGNTGEKYTLPAPSADSSSITASAPNVSVEQLLKDAAARLAARLAAISAGSSGSTSGGASGSTAGSKGGTGNSSSSKPSNEWQNGKWYDADGKSNYEGTGKWKNDANGWWYEDSLGWYPVSQWLKIDGKWYYFMDNGYMDYSEYRDGCWLGSDGAWVEEYSGGHWSQDANGWWYEDSAGWYPVSQYLWIDGTQYWFNANGYWE